jgi:A/G-specific adenine glycosylase
LVLRDAQDRLYLERRPTQGIWGGLLSLPEFDNLDQVKDYLGNFNQEPLPIEGGPPIQHTLTHFTLILTPVFVRQQGEPSALPRETAGWYAPHSVKGVPAPISKIIGQPVPSTSIDSGEL